MTQWERKCGKEREKKKERNIVISGSFKTRTTCQVFEKSWGLPPFQMRGKLFHTGEGKNPEERTTKCDIEFISEEIHLILFHAQINVSGFVFCGSRLKTNSYESGHLHFHVFESHLGVTLKLIIKQLVRTSFDGPFKNSLQKQGKWSARISKPATKTVPRFRMRNIGFSRR